MLTEDQLETIAWLNEAPERLLYQDIGTGKTVCILTWAQEANLRVLVVAPWRVAATRG
ncbi:MAG: DEAD/DEAH box helicase family protein [Myxococcales bacterium]|nr:DEAD/DEAH box helicase family protein [Myxococcales bacterium]